MNIENKEAAAEWLKKNPEFTGEIIVGDETWVVTQEDPYGEGLSQWIAPYPI